MHAVFPSHHGVDLAVGTPPRLDGHSINYEVLTPQEGDNPPTPFSFMNDVVDIPVGLMI